MPQIQLPQMDWLTVAPALIVTATGCLVIIIDLIVRSRDKTHLAVLSLVGLAVAFVVSWNLWDYNQVSFEGMVAGDNFSQFFTLAFLVITAFTILFSVGVLDREEMNQGEYYALLLFSCVGMILMASGTDLIVTFLGLELLSICLYVMSGLSRTRLASQEAAMKYLLLGAFAAAFFLYGIALVYGTAGSTNLAAIARVATSRNPLLLVGIGLLIVGLGFKAAVAPFHMWTPDVYEGAPTPVTAYMSVAAKAAAFAAMLRVFLSAFANEQLLPDWTAVLAVVALVTMIVGNVLAIWQNNIKRLLAYSSIAHAGYLLIGVVAASKLGAASVMFYTLAYTFMNLGAFAVVILLGRRGEENAEIDAYRGLATRQPVLAALMAVFMFSLSGLPPTAGFVGKFYLFQAAVETGWTWLAVAGVLASVVSVYYYLRVVVVMYMQEADRPLGPLQRAPWPAAAAALGALGVLFVGVFPTGLLDLAQQAAALLRA
jgi:NADH-quinone oxidoreductase subunit N